VEFFIYFWN